MWLLGKEGLGQGREVDAEQEDLPAGFSFVSGLRCFAGRFPV